MRLSYEETSARRTQLNALCRRPIEHVDTHGELMHAVFNLVYAAHAHPEGWRQLFLHWTHKEGITDGYTLKVLPSYVADYPLTYLGQRLGNLTAPYRI